MSAGTAVVLFAMTCLVVALALAMALRIGLESYVASVIR